MSGVGHERHREPHALLFAPGALAEAPVGEVGDAGGGEDVVDGPGVGEQGGDVLDALAHRQILEQSAGLHDGGDEATRDGRVRRHAEDADAARRRFAQAEDHVDRRRLARTVGAEERDDLAGRDLEVDPTDGLDAPVLAGKGLRHAGEGDGCVVHASSLAATTRAGLGRTSRPRHDKCHESTLRRQTAVSIGGSGVTLHREIARDRVKACPVRRRNRRVAL